jgi:hypothetical protein
MTPCSTGVEPERAASLLLFISSASVKSKLHVQGVCFQASLKNKSESDWVGGRLRWRCIISSDGTNSEQDYLNRIVK